MPHEFNDAEMYPCDLCGEYFPREKMSQLEDGICIDVIEKADTRNHTAQILR